MIQKAVYYKRVRKQPVGRNRRRGNKGVVFLPAEFIKKRIKITVEVLTKR
jgi:hypothetical protein